MTLKTASDRAIAKGNKFPGYLGTSPEDYSKDELILILNIIYDRLMDTRNQSASQDALTPDELLRKANSCCD